MTVIRLAIVVAILLTCGAAPRTAGVGSQRDGTPRERRVAVGKGSLFVREIGHGPPIVVVHGGPDFDHSYLLPELDRLSDKYHLIYYDQRGRGKSAGGVQPEDVTLESEISDLDQVRESSQLPSTAVLGHSWGAVLAMEYAIRHPERVSRLILLNPAPASADDWAHFRQFYAEKLGADLDRLRALASTPGYKNGDPDAVAAYYRVHFRAALTRPEQVDTIVARLRASFTRTGILKARAVETRLVAATWQNPRFNLLPGLARLAIPTLVIYSERDFIPPQAAEHIARAVQGARSVKLGDCGHFSYFDCPAKVHAAIDGLFQR